MEKLLESFDVRFTEARVYKKLLLLGGASVSQIAKNLGIIRTSCQEYIKNLVQKGLVNSTKIKNKYFYQAEDPDVLRQRIDERVYTLDRLLPKLKELGKQEEWAVASTTKDEVDKKLRWAKRKKFNVLKFGNEKVGGVIVNGTCVVLVSEYDELPVVEIVSEEIAKLHKILF